MIGEQLKIIKLFSEKSNVELTINQISKSIKKSYAFTNKYTHELIGQEVLKKKVIGNAIVCSLNLENEQALGILIMNSINKKILFEKSLKSDSKSELSEYVGGTDFSVGTVFLQDSILNVVCDVSNAAQTVSTKDSAIAQKKVSNFKINIITQERFAKELRELDLSKTIVLKGHERFWSMVVKK